MNNFSHGYFMAGDPDDPTPQYSAVVHDTATSTDGQTWVKLPTTDFERAIGIVQEEVDDPEKSVSVRTVGESYGIAGAAFSIGAILGANSAGELEGVGYASFSTNMTGNNNDLTFTAREQGEEGNEIQVEIVDSASNDVALSIVVDGKKITINSATDGSSAPTSTAAQIKTALEADAEANALVTVAFKTGNDGTGTVAAAGVALTNLTGGGAGALRPFAVAEETATAQGDIVKVRILATA